MNAPEIETKIWLALRGRVETLPLAFPVEWPSDEDFIKPQTDGMPAPYIEVRHLPNTINRRFIGSDEPQDRPGILQLTLIYPVALKHRYEVMVQYAGLMAAHFPTDHLMRFEGIVMRVEKAPDVAQPIRDDAYWQVPISIRWRVDF